MSGAVDKTKQVKRGPCVVRRADRMEGKSLEWFRTRATLYQLFGLSAASFSVAALEKEYRRLSRLHHPDKSWNKTRGDARDGDPEPWARGAARRAEAGRVRQRDGSGGGDDDCRGDDDDDDRRCGGSNSRELRRSAGTAKGDAAKRQGAAGCKARGEDSEKTRDKEALSERGCNRRARQSRRRMSTRS